MNRTLCIKASVILILICMIVKVYLFAQSLGLSDQINKIDDMTKAIRVQNSELEKQLYSQTSLSRLEDIASQLGFERKNPLIYQDRNFAFAHE